MSDLQTYEISKHWAQSSSLAKTLNEQTEFNDPQTLSSGGHELPLIHSIAAWIHQNR